jgi:type II secretory pathway pseudopilin PulG
MPVHDKPHRSRGFTALELLIVIGLAVVIVAILRSAYHTFTSRAEVRAAIGLAQSVKAAIESHYLERGEVPQSDRDLAGRTTLPGSTPETIGVSNGRIDLRFGAAAGAALRGRTISLTPYETLEREVVWVCGNRVPGVGLNPLGFLSGGRESVQIAATIEARYLPRHCR